MKNHKILATLVATVLVTCLMTGDPATVSAADVSLGLGVGATPDYEGSDDYEAWPIPLLSVEWPNHMSLDLSGNAIHANLLPSDFWKFGPAVEFIRDRGDDVDDDKVSKLNQVSASVMTGAFFGIKVGHWFFNVEGMQDLADGNDGAIFRFNSSWTVPFNEFTNMVIGGFITYADDDYMDAYFGIDAKNAARSGLDTFEADGGLKDAGASLAVSFSPWKNEWGILCMGSYTRLVKDAKSSPVTDDQGSADQVFGGIAVTYTF
jgi:outer membrane protein